MLNETDKTPTQQNVYSRTEHGFMCGYCRAFNAAPARVCGCGDSRREVGRPITPPRDVDSIAIEF